MFIKWAEGVSMLRNDLESLDTGTLNDCKSDSMKINDFERGSHSEGPVMEDIQYY
jgi:hypothetical protein